MKNLTEIAQCLKNAREQQSESIADLAHKLALSPAQLRALEAADSRPFYSEKFLLQAALRYATLLKVSLPAAPVDLAPEDPKASAQPAMPEPIAPLAADPGPAARTTADGPSAPMSESPTPSDRPDRRRIKHPQQLVAASVAVIAIVVLLTGWPRTDQSSKNSTQVVMITPPVSLSAETNAAAPSQTAPGPSSSQAPAETPSALATSQANAAQSSGSAVTVAKNGADSALRSEARTWVQIVAIDGTKTNLNTTPGELIRFKAKETAAIVFGQPSAAHLEIQGRPVDLSRFVVEPERRRALVIIREALQNP